MRRLLSIIAAFALLLAFPASAQRGSGASVDLFRLSFPPGTSGVNRDTKSIALSSSGQTVSAAVRNLILIVAGQSNTGNITPSTYTPANPTKVDMLNVYDGAIYKASDPILGAFGALVLGNPYLRVADTLVTNNKFDRVILVGIGIGGTKVADHAPGGFLQDLFPVAMRRIAANGIVAGTNITIAAIWAQGEDDTVAGTSQSAYTNSLNAYITASRTAGFTGIWFVNVETLSGSTSAAIQAAQAAVVNHGASVWAGANADALSGSTCGGLACRSDGVHWSDAGAVSIAAAVVTAMGLAGAPF